MKNFPTFEQRVQIKAKLEGTLIKGPSGYFYPSGYNDIIVAEQLGVSKFAVRNMRAKLFGLVRRPPIKKVKQSAAAKILSQDNESSFRDHIAEEIERLHLKIDKLMDAWGVNHSDLDLPEYGRQLTPQEIRDYADQVEREQKSGD